MGHAFIHTIHIHTPPARECNWDFIPTWTSDGACIHSFTLNVAWFILPIWTSDGVTGMPLTHLLLLHDSHFILHDSLTEGNTELTSAWAANKASTMSRCFPLAAAFMGVPMTFNCIGASKQGNVASRGSSSGASSEHFREQGRLSCCSNYSVCSTFRSITVVTVFWCSYSIDCYIETTRHGNMLSSGIVAWLQRGVKFIVGGEQDYKYICKDPLHSVIFSVLLIHAWT